MSSGFGFDWSSGRDMSNGSITNDEIGSAVIAPTSTVGAVGISDGPVWIKPAVIFGGFVCGVVVGKVAKK